MQKLLILLTAVLALAALTDFSAQPAQFVPTGSVACIGGTAAGSPSPNVNRRARPSLAFLHAFYDALAAYRPVDVAMVAARRAVQLEETGAGWGLPHLISRIPDGQLFEQPAPPPPASKPRLHLRSVLTRK